MPRDTLAAHAHVHAHVRSTAVFTVFHHPPRAGRMFVFFVVVVFLFSAFLFEKIRTIARSARMGR
jgi:hypothetical protein